MKSEEERRRGGEEEEGLFKANAVNWEVMVEEEDFLIKLQR